MQIQAPCVMNNECNGNDDYYYFCKFFLKKRKRWLKDKENKTKQPKINEMKQKGLFKEFFWPMRS